MAGMSPMMVHYLETKKQYPDCILFYRLGDFYEMFFEDALTVSKELEITLTGKECGLEERAPMCGVPYHALDNYLYRLVQKGYKVAIAEQMEDPKQAKGLVKREVIRVVTPGTITSAQALDETKNNYLMGIVYIDERFGIAVSDISTGDFLVTEVASNGNWRMRSTNSARLKLSATMHFSYPVWTPRRSRTGIRQSSLPLTAISSRMKAAGRS